MKTVTGVRAVPHLLGGRIDLSWQNPPNSDFDAGPSLSGIRIVRRERTFPLTLDDGDLVYPVTQPILPQSSESLLAQFSDDGLQPLTTYYYTIFTVDAANVSYADDNSRAAAFATQNYNLSERLYRMLPAVHQRYDVPGATQMQSLGQATRNALAALPPNLSGKGQLWRFLYAVAAPTDLMRSFAEGLPLLRNVDVARPEFLPLLAQWLGWELDRTLPIFAQRNEIKFAPRLYRGVGTIPNLQAIVTRYTGWYAQVAEFVQNIALSNAPPQLNVFAIMQAPDGGWPGTDDAAPAFNFTPQVNNVLTDLISAKGPFALRAGMELSIITDANIPAVLRFQPGDFVDITQATAAEVVSVFNRLLPDVKATANPDSTIELNALFSIQIERSAASLVTLEGAPGGRLSTVVGKVDPSRRIRLFYEMANPLDPLTALNASQAVGGGLTPGGVVPGGTRQALPCGGPVPTLIPVPALPITPTVLPSLPQGRVHYKTFRGDAWGESYPLPLTPGTLAQKDPAVVELPDGSIWVAWIDVVNPNTDGTLTQPLQYHLRYSRGTVTTPQPALLRGQAREPFTITPGTRLLFRGNWLGGEEGFEFVANDFANWQQARAVEVVTALTTRLKHVTASVDPAKRILLLATVDSGGDKFLEIDGQSSTAAQALGFNSGNAMASKAYGDWGDAVVKWSPPQEVVSATPGLNADLHAVVDASGVVWLFWASYDGPTSNWRIVDSRWNRTTNTWSSLEVVADGLGGNREPYAILDNTNRIWLFWSRRQGVSTLEDNWTLEYRVFDGTSWGPETSLTSTPTDGDGRAADREPAAVLLPNGDLQVFFRSDRRSPITDGLKLWSITITPSTSAVVGPGVITTDYNADYRPAPIVMPDGKNTLWLLYRSDRSVSLSGIATRSLPTQQNRVTDPAPVASAVPAGPLLSTRAPGAGTLRRYTGSTSVFLSNVARNSRQGLWDDLLAYTPQNPQGDQPLGDSDYYTRGTLGLYLNQVTPDSPLSQQRVDRLRPVLDRFLPINVRAVVILSPPALTEYVYQPDVDPTADIQESYQDNYPFVEYYDGPQEGPIAAALPDWDQFHSNTLSDVSASVTDLTTLRHRTYFPPPQ